MTEEQRTRWLDDAKKYDTTFLVGKGFMLREEDFLSICATITAEAVAAERSHVLEGAGMTDRKLADACWKIFDLLNHGDNMKALDLARALIAEATARERERCARWRPIETAPRDGTLCMVWAAPYQDLNGFVTWCAYHEDGGWCIDELRKVTHWMPLPDGPSAAAHQAGEE